MLQYRIRKRVMPKQKGQNSPRTRFITQVGHRRLQPGEVFAHFGWPPLDFEPVNDAAKKVAAYYAANAGNSALLSSHWCMLNGLFLPELPGASTDTYAKAIDSEIQARTGRRPGERGSVPKSTPSGPPLA